MIRHLRRLRSFLSMNRAIPAFLTLVLAGCAGTHQPKRRGNLFSELQPGERVHIRFLSTGCFHNDAYDFDFERDGATTVRVAAVSRSCNAVGKSMPYRAINPLGTLILTPRDISGLDRLIRFYRTHPAGGCTTRDDITIDHFRWIHRPDSPAIASEHYIDASCDTDDLPGVRTLSSLARRLEAKTP
jgi:hypothetical protein